jgi:cytochrome c6
MVVCTYVYVFIKLSTMKFLLKNIALTLLLALSLFMLNLRQPAFAADLEAGVKIFKANCVSCHLNGNNNVQKDKTLKLEALQANNMYSLEAIMTQVKNGKNVMPAFGKKLKPADIENVATYVLAQADNGWKKK